MLLPFLLMDFEPMSPTQLLCLIMAGVSATVGQFGITSAYKFAPAKEISVFDYMQVVFAAFIGMFFLDEIPVFASIIGYVIIIGVAVFRWYTNLNRDRGGSGNERKATANPCDPPEGSK